MTQTLDPMRWNQVESLFDAALELEPNARVAFLQSRSEGDQEVVDEVLSLLGAFTGSKGFLDRPLLHAVKEVAGEETMDRLQAGSRLSHYAIDSKIGAGGMGQVYRATDTRLRRPIALKVLAPYLTCDLPALRRFEQEAHAASALNHPNILTVFEFGEVDGLHYLAAELIEGPTLRQKLQQGRLEMKTAVGVATQIASALVAAHASGIVHRDIKPENILIRSDGLVKLVDFGIAKLGEERGEGCEDASAPRLEAEWNRTLPGTAVGTPRYMSPEQAARNAADSRSDLFSLGAVLYEMLAGAPAFSGDSQEEITRRIRTVDPPLFSDYGVDVPLELELMVEKALRKEPEARYQTARDLLVDLQQFQRKFDFEANLVRAGFTPSGSLRPRPAADAVSGSQAQAPSLSLPTPGSSSKPAMSRRIRWIAIWPALAVSIVVATILALRGSSPPTPESPQRIAILPFRNVNHDPSADFLEVSLAEALINKLGYVKALRVRPSSAVKSFRDGIGSGSSQSAMTPLQIAGQLHVDLLLTGTYRKDGNQLQIATQLLDAGRNAILWRRTMTIPYEELLTVQDRLTQQIVDGLSIRLSPEETEQIALDRPENKLAYEYYLRGVDLYSMNEFTGAIDEFKKSIDLEPNYALAWAHLGRSYTTHASLQFGGREQYEDAKEAYAKALSLDPGLVDVRVYMANLLTDTGRVEEAMPLLREALATNPGFAEAHWELGYADRFAGMLDESVAESEEARRLDPEVKMNSSAINGYLYRGEYRKFLDSLPLGNSGYTLFYRGLAQYYLKDYDQAEQEFDRAYDQDKNILPAPIGKALSDGLKHRSAEGLKLLEETETRFNAQGVSDPEMLYKMAQAYAALGDTESALRALQQSADGGFFSAPYLAKDPMMDSLRGNPRFCVLAGRIDARHRQFLLRFGEHR